MFYSSLFLKQLLVDEFEEKLEQCHSKGVEDEEASNKATNAQVAARALKSRNGRKTPAKTPGNYISLNKLVGK